MQPGRQEAAPVANVPALLAGALALSITTWYLATGFPWTLINLGLALVLVLWPLRPPWPLTRQRLMRVVIWWVAGGLLGAYVFGVQVFVAGLVVGMALLVESLMKGDSNKT